MGRTAESKNKALVLEAFDTLFNKRDYVAAEKFWSPHYIQHSAHIAPGREGLFDLIKGLPPTLKYEPGTIVAEGNFVIVHGRFSGFGQPVNWIAADIVRIKDGTLVEHWDVIQDEATREASKSGEPMFGGQLPGVNTGLTIRNANTRAKLNSKERDISMKSINKSVEIPAPTMRNVLKRNSMRFATALLVALASFVTAPNAALAGAPQHHDQAPGFYRLKVGDLEVTALYDGTGVFDPRWLNGTKPTMDGVVKALQEDPHMLDVVDSGFLVNTGKQRILVDAGAGSWWGGGALGRLAGSLRSAGYTPEEVDIVLLTHLHSDHVGGLTTQDGNRVFPNAEVYVAKAESDFWLSPEIAAKAPKDAQAFFQSAQAIAAPYIKAGKWHTFSGSEPIVDGMQVVPLPGHTPGHTGYEFSSKGQKILFWGDIVHVQRVQFQHPEVTAIFDTDQTAAAATRNQLLARLARENVLIATPHTSLFPALGRLHKEGSGYSWVPVVFTDQWDET